MSRTLLAAQGRLNGRQESATRSDDELFDLAVGAAQGKRLSPEDALALYEQADLHLLGRAATLRKAAVKDDRFATYVIDRNVSYTNACIAYCTFCAFYRPPGHKDVWTWDTATILRKVDELVAMGGTQVMLQGGLNPDLHLDYYEEVFRAIKDRHPHVALHSLTATEIDFLAKQEDTTHKEIVLALKKAGWDSLPGGGAEILVERVRQKVSPLKNSGQVWQDVHALCHSLGIPTTATMTYGHMETNAERIEHLRIVRGLQDKAKERGGAGCFTAMIPWSMSPSGTKLEGRIETATGTEYLRTQAICRLFLDNVENLQAGWLTNGPKLAQLALDFGANDFGGILMEEQVVSATGVKPDLTIQEIVAYIQQTGRIAVQRDTYYHHLKVHT